jgi:hypothetical protein
MPEFAIRRPPSPEGLLGVYQLAALVGSQLAQLHGS